MLGLRNPYTFAVQPGTGTIFINDVGENTWEEIDQSVAGANYGWSGGNTDGFGQSSRPARASTTTRCSPTTTRAARPAAASPSSAAPSTTRPRRNSPASYVGKYFYADLGGGWIRVFDPANPGSASNPDTSTAFATGIPGNLLDLKVDPAGNLYYLTGTGTVEKISFQAPRITTQPASQTVDEGQPATFTVAASGPSLSYQWQHLVGASLGATWGRTRPRTRSPRRRPPTPAATA